MRNSSGPFGPENGHDSISSNNSGNGSNRIHGNSNNISPRLGGMRGRADIRNDYRLVAIRVGQYRFQNNSNFNMGRSRASWQGARGIHCYRTLRPYYVQGMDSGL